MSKEDKNNRISHAFYLIGQVNLHVNTVDFAKHVAKAKSAQRFAANADESRRSILRSEMTDHVRRARRLYAYA